MPGHSLLALRRDPLTFFTHLADEARTRGDVASVPIPCQSVVLFSHQDHVREILVSESGKFGRGLAILRTRMVLGDGLLTSDGERHLRRRRLMQPSFSRRAPEAHVEAIAAMARSHRTRWRAGHVVDVSTEMTTLAMRAVSHVLFGEEMGDSVDEAAAALGVLLEFSDRLVLPGSRLWTSIPTRRVRRARMALETLDRILFGVIEAKRRRGPGADVLSALIDAREADDPRVKLTDRELRDEAMTLLLAGHETTASALAWTWHLLSRHPEVQDRMASEVEALVAARGVSGADLDRLVYVEQVFAEAMRLFPPVWSIGRRALEEVTIGGARLEAGTLAVLSQWVIHRDSRVWPQPERFDPSRFTGDGPSRRIRPGYFPFGDGPRRCIGESLAWAIGVTVLAALVRQVRFLPVEDVDIVPIAYLFLLAPGHRPRGDAGRPRRGLPLRVACA